MLRTEDAPHLTLPALRLPQWVVGDSLLLANLLEMPQPIHSDLGKTLCRNSATTPDPERVEFGLVVLGAAAEPHGCLCAVVGLGMGSSRQSHQCHKFAEHISTNAESSASGSGKPCMNFLWPFPMHSSSLSPCCSPRTMRSYQKLRTSVPQLVLSQEEEEEENSTTPTAAGRSKLAPWWVGSGLLITAVLLSTITVWVLRQVSRGWHGPAPPSQCHLVPESHRYDCYPERSVVVTQELCESRGCCFIETLPAVGGKRGVPWCFYPPNFPSYVVQSLNQTALGMTGLLVRREKAYYPKDIQVLRMDVEFQTNTRLRIKVSVPPALFQGSALCTTSVDVVPCSERGWQLLCSWHEHVSSVSISSPPVLLVFIVSFFPVADNRCSQAPV